MLAMNNFNKEHDDLWEQCPEGAIQDVAVATAARLLATKEQDDLWVQCPEGAIQEVAESTLVARAAKPAVDPGRRKFLYAAATAAGVAILGGGAYLTSQGDKSGHGSSPSIKSSGPIATMDYAGISCVEVVQNIPAYIEKTIEDTEKSDKIKEHLQLCKKCRETYNYQLES